MMATLRSWRLPCLAALAAMLAGCGANEVWWRDGTWRPLGANEQNLRAMLVEPRDVVQGMPVATTSDGQTSALAVERLRADRVKRLPDSGVARLVTVGAGVVGGGSD